MEDKIIKENARLVKEVLDLFVKNNLSYARSMSVLTNCLITIYNNTHDSTPLQAVQRVIEVLQETEERLNNNSIEAIKVKL